MQPIGKVLIITGLVITSIGLFLNYLHKIPFLGKLPGDINFKGKKFFCIFSNCNVCLIEYITFIDFLFYQ